MAFGSAHGKARPNNDTGIVSTQDKTTMEEWVTAERRKVMVAGDRHVKSSTATTVSTESKQTGSSSNAHTSSDILEEETDPTSSPSEMFDEPDRKYTESPIDSDRAVYGSNSVHSDSSDSSTEHSDSKKNMTTAADLEKVGGQFDESCTGREAASFHNPANDVEAKYINDKVIKANSEHFHSLYGHSSLTESAATTENIFLHPEVHFRDPGSSFQVSARPKEPAEPALDADGDIGHKGKVHLAPEPLLHIDIEEGNYTERLARRRSPCCFIL